MCDVQLSSGERCDKRENGRRHSFGPLRYTLDFQVGLPLELKRERTMSR